MFIVQPRGCQATKRRLQAMVRQPAPQLAPHSGEPKSFPLDQLSACRLPACYGQCIKWQSGTPVVSESHGRKIAQARGRHMNEGGAPFAGVTAHTRLLRATGPLVEERQSRERRRSSRRRRASLNWLRIVSDLGTTCVRSLRLRRTALYAGPHHRCRLLGPSGLLGCQDVPYLDLTGDGENRRSE